MERGSNGFSNAD